MVSLALMRRFHVILFLALTLWSGCGVEEVSSETCVVGDDGLDIEGDAADDADEISALQRLRDNDALDTLQTEGQLGNSVEVFVMLSLTTVNQHTGKLNDPVRLRENLTKIKETGATGVMTDVWWGITEPEPKKYDFSAYRQLSDMLKEIGLKVQVVTSFHQCGTETDPSTYIPLPGWVRNNSGIWFKNAIGSETKAYVSLFADNVKVGSRTPKQMYKDWMKALEREFSRDIACGHLVEIMVGLGTDGELKYPSYENGPWTFPGIGMFQAFDQHALKSLARYAHKAGKPESWGTPPGKEMTGTTNSFPQQTEFFSTRTKGWTTEKSRFFLQWYCNSLVEHAESLLPVARKIFGRKVRLSGKIAGVHWWYKYPSHPAELTAGYYNANAVNGYGDIANVFKRNGGVLVDFTCLEMTDASQNPEYDCGPQELVLQVQSASKHAGVDFTGENALSFYDVSGYDQMVSYKPPTGYLKSVTYLRISDQLFEPHNLETFTSFVSKMQDFGFTTPWTVKGSGETDDDE